MLSSEVLQVFHKEYSKHEIREVQDPESNNVSGTEVSQTLGALCQNKGTFSFQMLAPEVP